MAGLVDYHNLMLRSPDERQMTMLSMEGKGQGKTELFMMEGARVIRRKKFEGFTQGGYKLSTQAGVYVISRGMLMHPFMTLLGPKHNNVFRYLSIKGWADYGNPASFK